MATDTLVFILFKVSTVRQSWVQWDLPLLRRPPGLTLYSHAFCHPWSLRFIQYCLCIILPCLFAFIVKGLYNRYFHPLRNFPGPFGSSFTDLYKLYVLSSRDVTSMSLELHKQYGPIVRVAPNFLSFSDPLMIPAVYHRNADKDDFWTPGFLGEHPPLIQTLDHRKHVSKRKIIASMLSTKSLLSLESKVDEGILSLRDTFRMQYVLPRLSSNLSNWTKWFLYDTTTTLIFGHKIGFTNEERDVDGVLDAFRSRSWFFGLMALFPYLFNPIIKFPVIKRFILPHSGDKKGVGKIMTHRDRLTTGAKSAAGHNLLKLLNTHGAKRQDPLSEEDINAELLMLMIAAPDTTSALICSTINNVIQHSAIHSRLNSEITAATASESLDFPIASFAQIERLPYFTACVQEAARLFPPIPVIISRRVSPGGLCLNGHFIPEGTAIGASAAVINRDPHVFGVDAGVFRPERWLEEPAKVAQMQRFMFSWGFGSRKCVAKHLALLETYKFCFQLFRDFEVTSATPQKPWEKHEDFGFAIYDDQWLFLNERRAVPTSSH